MGNIVSAGVIANNPKYGAWGGLLEAAVTATLNRFHSDYGPDASGSRAPWYKRILPW